MDNGTHTHWSNQAVWTVALAGEQQRRLVVERLAGRFRDCVTEKNHTLIRYDIIEGLRRIYDAAGDEQVWEGALALVETEEDTT
jgi:hypothetical protein